MSLVNKTELPSVKPNEINLYFMPWPPWPLSFSQEMRLSLMAVNESTLENAG